MEPPSRSRAASASAVVEPSGAGAVNRRSGVIEPADAEASARLLVALSEMAEHTARCDSEEGLAAAFLGVAQRLTRSPLSLVGILNTSRRLDVLAHSLEQARGAGPDAADRQTGLRDLPLLGCCRDIATGNTPRTFEQVSRRPEGLGLPNQDRAIERLLGIPLAWHGHVLGLAWVADAREPYGKQDPEHLQTLTDIFVPALMALRSRRELQEAEEQARAATQVKNLFLANMSHELRTPLNAVLGMADLTLKTTLNAEQRENLTILRDSAYSLLDLVSDVLDFARVEAGQLRLQATRFGLHDLLERLLDSLALRAADRGIELVGDIEAGVPRVVVGDAGRLRQILLNVLGNALKFTDEGEVVLRVRVAGWQPDRVRLFLSVHDTGVGIPLEQQQQVFEPFAQASTPSDHHRPGTGLGLSIVRQLVGMMDGTVHLRSVPGSGTDVHLLVWLGRDAATPWPTSAAPGCLDGARVLVAEGNATSRQVFVRHLKSWRCRVLSVGTASEALQVLAEEHKAGRSVELVLADHDLPERGAEDLAVRIGADPRVGTPHVVLLTPVGARQGDARSLPTGIRSAVTKPVRSALLRATVVSVLESERRTPTERPPPSAPAAGRFDLRFQGTRVLVAEDNPFNQKVMVRLLEGLGCSVSVAANGTQAVRAVRAGQFDLVFMDVQMPGGDGLSATRSIRVEEGDDGAGIPIVAMTAYALDGDRERCLAAGMDDYLTKPATEAALAGALERWTDAGPNSTPAEPQVGAGASERHSRTGLTHGAVEAPPTAGALVAQIVERFGGDLAFAADIAALFLDQSPAALSALQQAVAARCGRDAELASHRLKGMLINLGVPSAAETCGQIEASVGDGQWQVADGLLRQSSAELEALCQALRDELAPPATPHGG